MEKRGWITAARRWKQSNEFTATGSTLLREEAPSRMRSTLTIGDDLFSYVRASLYSRWFNCARTQTLLGGKVSRRTSIKLLRATGHRRCGCTVHPAARRVWFHLLCFIPHSPRWCTKSLFIGDSFDHARAAYDGSNIVSWNPSISRSSDVKAREINNGMYVIHQE